MALDQGIVSARPVHGRLHPRDLRHLHRLPPRPAVPTTRPAAETAERVARLLGSQAATVRVYLPDRAGRLREAAVAGSGPPDRSPRPRDRRRVFRTGLPLTVPLGSPGGRVVAIHPLVRGEQVVGVVEVVAPEGVLSARRGAIRQAVEMSGMSGGGGKGPSGSGQGAREADPSRAAPAGEGEPTRSAAAGEDDPSRAAALARDLMRSADARTALRRVLAFCAESFGVAAAGWLAAGQGSRAELVGVRGVSARRAAELRRQVPWFPRWDLLPVPERHRVGRAFARVVGSDHVSVLPVGGAVVLAGGLSLPLKRCLRVLGPLLEDVLAHLATVTWAERRNEELDLAVASTAHEIRGPAVAARVAIEHVLTMDGMPGSARSLLRRSVQELDYLSEVAESLLRWAVGGRPARRRGTDLARLAREAARSCRLEMATEKRIRVRAPGRVPARVEPNHIRAAIANLIRNAVLYSPPGAEVRVELAARNGSARLSVADRGPGVPLAERDALFDPFVRGQAGRHNRMGAGLGLFITRRVVEAHGGRVWVESNGRGATFHIELPTR